MCKNRFFTYIFQKKTVKKKQNTSSLPAFLKVYRWLNLKKDEENGILPTNNALKWFIKKQITKCRKSCLGYLCSVSTYPFVIFSRRNPIGHSKFGRIQQGIGHRNIHYIYVLRWSVYVNKEPSIDKAYRRNSRYLLKFERNPPKQKTQWWR